MVLTFNQALSGVSDARPDWDLQNAFGGAWSDLGGGGSVSGNQYFVTLFFTGPPSGPADIAAFTAAGGPIVALSGATWGAQAFPVLEI